jgi:hypothetical protein
MLARVLEELFPSMIVMMGLAMIAPVVWLIMRWNKRIDAQRQIMKTGRRDSGTLVSFGRAGMGVSARGGDKHTPIAFEVRLADGRTVAAETILSGRLQLHLEPGMAIPLRIDDSTGRAVVDVPALEAALGYVPTPLR